MKHFPAKGFTALTMWPFVFIRKDRKEQFSAKAERHETTHGLQQVEMLLIFFFLLYGLEWLVKLPFCMFDTTRAYMSISFEQEAYTHQDDPHYLENRKPYTWLHLIFTIIH